MTRSAIDDARGDAGDDGSAGAAGAVVVANIRQSSGSRTREEDAEPRQPGRYRRHERRTRGSPPENEHGNSTAGLLARGSTRVRLAFPVVGPPVALVARTSSPLTVAES